MITENNEHLILKSIHEGEETIRQRDIAKVVGLSLGMTNTIIKRLVEKGYLKVSHFNSKNIKYLLTPEGLSRISKKSSEFLKRTIKNVVVFNEAIDLIVANVKKENYSTINLIGESDLFFLIENSCLKNQIALRSGNIEIIDSQTKNIYSEDFLPKTETNHIYLAEKLDAAIKAI